MVTSQPKEKRKLPQKRFVPWSITERNGNKLCPLCGEEYDLKNFKKLPPKLSLSEWHPNNLEPDYFEKKIAHISDAELYESIDWRILPGQTETAKDAKMYTTAIEAFITKKARKGGNDRYYGYSQSDESAFITVDEYRALMRADTARYNTLMRYAEEVVNYNIPYGTSHFKFEKAIDFNYNFGESGKYGFHYWGWGYYLTSAYMLTRDARYVEAFDAMFNQWYEQRNSISNPLPQFDVVWYELGIAARVPMFIDALRLFKNAPELRLETRTRILKTLLGSGRWLAEALKRNPYHPYNWPIHTALSGAYLALTFPEFKESRSWLDAARKVMEEHMKRDVYADGGYLERTPGYSYGVFNHFYRYLLLFQHFAKDKSYVARHRGLLEKMVEFNVLTMSPLGTNCPFNDSFRSSVVDFVCKHGNEVKRGDFLGPILPFLSEKHKSELAVKPTIPKVTSVNLPDSRFAVMRSGWTNDALMMIINYGPAANHHHEDILDFEVYAYGKAIAIDAGIGPKGYDDELHRSWYRASASHNMVMVNDTSIGRGEANGEDVIWASQKFTDYFAASHSGYEKSLGIRNRRHIVFVKRRYWVIYDEIDSRDGGQKLDWLFHSPLMLEEYKSGYRSKGSPGFLLLLADGSSRSVKRIKSEGMASLAGLPDEKEAFRKINYISFQRVASRDLEENRFGVLVFPYVDRAPELEFRFLRTSPGVTGYAVKDGENEDRLLFSDGKKRAFADGIESDAQFICAQYEKDRLKKLSVVGAALCSVDGKLILKERKRRDFEGTY